MPEYADVPEEVVARLRSVCLELPEAYEEQAWVGTRWRVRKHTFAHVLTIDSVLGMVVDGDSDWDEVAELLTESYCVLAPRKLVALVDRPAE